MRRRKVWPDRTSNVRLGETLTLVATSPSPATIGERTCRRLRTADRTSFKLTYLCASLLWFPSLRVPSSTTVATPVLSPERSPAILTRTPSTISTVYSVSMRTDALDDNASLFEEPILEEVSTESSLLSTHRSPPSRAVGFRAAVFGETYVIPQISPAHIPLLRSPSMRSMPTASPSFSMTTPRGSTPSIRSD